MMASINQVPRLAAFALLAMAACSKSDVMDSPADLQAAADLHVALDMTLPDAAVVDLLPPDDLTPVADLAIDGVGKSCGGFGGKQCPVQLYCDFPNQCGAADQPGTCQARPANCPKNLDPVCGCDSVQYGNDCLRQQAGTSLFNHGVCGCGFCDQGSYCADCKAGPICLPNGQVC